MPVNNEQVGPKILAKIKIYVLTRAELLFNLCYEIPCMQTIHDFDSKFRGKLLNLIIANTKYICNSIFVNLYENTIVGTYAKGKSMVNLYIVNVVFNLKQCCTTIFFFLRLNLKPSINTQFCVKRVLVE